MFLLCGPWSSSNSAFALSLGSCGSALQRLLEPSAFQTCCCPPSLSVRGRFGDPEVLTSNLSPVFGNPSRREAAHEQEHISVSQVGAGRNPFSTKRAVLIAERQVPGRVLDHQVEHARGQLVVVNAGIPR